MTDRTESRSSKTGWIVKSVVKLLARDSGLVRDLRLFRYVWCPDGTLIPEWELVPTTFPTRESAIDAYERVEPGQLGEVERVWVVERTVETTDLEEELPL